MTGTPGSRPLRCDEARYDMDIFDWSPPPDTRSVADRILLGKLLWEWSHYG